MNKKHLKNNFVYIIIKKLMSYQDKNLKSLKYKIYSVPNYKKYVLEVKNPKITVEAPCFASRKFKKIVKELETYDCQYHLAIRKDDMLKLNIDIDKSNPSQSFVHKNNSKITVKFHV
jgi:hypothetical protein